MNKIPTLLSQLVLVEPDVYRDGRGFFLETYSAKKYPQHNIPAEFVQDNHSKSIKGTLRGLHGQLKNPQGKLVRVIQGEIYDVAVDARPDSETFGKFEGIILNQENFRQLYIPPGFLHGFYVISPTAEIEYKCTTHYDSHDEIGVFWNDPSLQISWPIDQGTIPILSEKDKKLPRFEEIKNIFEVYKKIKLF